MVVDCIKNIATIRKLYDIEITPVLEKYDITAMEFNLLMFLHNNPKMDTAKEVSQFICFTKSHVSMAVKQLSEKGYIERNNKDNDRRTVHLTICKKAKKIIDDGIALQETLIRKLLKGFSEEEIELFSDMLNRIVTNINE